MWSRRVTGRSLGRLADREIVPLDEAAALRGLARIAEELEGAAVEPAPLREAREADPDVVDHPRRLSTREPCPRGYSREARSATPSRMRSGDS